MPQMSPIWWPLVITILMTSMISISCNMPKYKTYYTLTTKKINKNTKTSKW